MRHATVVPDVAGGLTEDKINGKAFELVFAFDEVITTGGHKENITLPQVCLPVARVFPPLVTLLVRNGVSDDSYLVVSRRGISPTV